MQRRSRPRRELGMTIVGLVLVACSPAARERPLEHIDLCENPPRVEAGDGTQIAARARVARVPLGPANLSTLRGHSASSEDVNPWSLRPGLAPALAQPSGHRLVFPVTLRQPAFLEFRPLDLGERGGAARPRISIRRGDRETIVWEQQEPQAPWPPPDLVSLDLREFSPAAQPVEVVLELAGHTTSNDEFYWVSPRIVTGMIALATPGTPADRPDVNRPNVLLIGADTLRADALGAYGARPSVTPALDRFAASSDLWLDAYSTFNVTLPSFASILTGLYGKNHGVYENKSRLSDEARTLAEMLREAGYATAAFLAARHLFTGNLGQGFDHLPEPKRHLAAETSIAGAINWIQSTHEPFFVWVHLYDPHTPHTPPGRFGRGQAAAAPGGLLPVDRWTSVGSPSHDTALENELFASRQLYLGEVAYVDREVDRLLGFLESRGLFENTIIVFLSDHGELIDEHGGSFRHTGFWEEVVHVPLIIRWPTSKRLGRRIRGLVQTIDVLPSILEALNLPIPPMDGRPLLTPNETSKRRLVFAEHGRRAGSMLRTEAEKYFYSTRDYAFPAGEYFYEVHGDPTELDNAAGTRPNSMARLRATLTAWQSAKAGGIVSEQQALTADELEQLRALGYLN